MAAVLVAARPRVWRQQVLLPRRPAPPAGELPEVQVGSRSSRERIAIGFDTASADDHDGVRTKLRDGVSLGRVAEGDESQVHALRTGDPEVGACRAARFLAGGAAEFVFGLDPTRATAGGVGLAILAICDQRLTAHHNVLERSHRRKLSVHWLALGEEGQIKTGFHVRRA